MNKFVFMGRLTKDAELKNIGEDKKVVNFSLAVNRKFANQNGEREADFFNLIAFGKTAEFINKYFSKGKQMLVEGRMQNKTWEDKEGNKRYGTDYIVEQTYFAGSKNDNENNSDNGSFVTVDTEELPF